MIEMDEYYKDYTKDISGWETLVDELRDENRFDTELFLKNYPEAFELLKPYFMEKMLPKFIARLLSNMKVFFNYECDDYIDGNDDLENARMMAHDLWNRVLDYPWFIKELSVERHIDPSGLTDDQCVVGTNPGVQVVEVSEISKYFK